MKSHLVSPNLGRNLLCLAVALSATGCGNSLNCALLGDNLRGRVSLAADIPLEEGADIIVEWSDDSFATVSNSNSSTNVHGLVAIPYTACISNDIAYAVRAYQDTNQNGKGDAGEYLGQYDDTSDGNGTLKTITVPGSADNNEWQVEDGIDITLDTQI
jgi:hypothetical protein